MAKKSEWERGDVRWMGVGVWAMAGVGLCGFGLGCGPGLKFEQTPTAQVSYVGVFGPGTDSANFYGSDDVLNPEDFAGAIPAARADQLEMLNRGEGIELAYDSNVTSGLKLRLIACFEVQNFRTEILNQKFRPVLRLIVEFKYAGTEAETVTTFYAWTAEREFGSESSTASFSAIPFLGVRENELGLQNQLCIEVRSFLSGNGGSGPSTLTLRQAALAFEPI